MAMLLSGLAAVAFDLSLAMADRRDLQAESDNAALAGAASYSTSANAAHWVTMQYLQKPLGFTLPQGTCTSSSACPAATYTIGKYTVTIADAGSKQMDLSIQHQEPAIFASLIGAGVVTTGSSVRAQAPGPTIITANYSVAAVSGDLTCGGCGAGGQNVSGSVYAYGNFGATNGGHSIPVPSVVKDYAGTTCNPSTTNTVNLGGASDSDNYNWTGGSGTQVPNVPTSTAIQYDNAAPSTAGLPTFTTIPAAKDGSGNWKPGIYDGIYPGQGGAGKLNPGIYKVINVTSGTMTINTTLVTDPGPGLENPNGAMTIMLDSSDTASLNFSGSTLNGLDDLHPLSYTGPRDPQGTHNFVFWSSSGANGYAGNAHISANTTTYITGIYYMPKSTFDTNGNPTFAFDGATFVASGNVQGGGSGTQQFNYVCGIGAVLGNPAIQGGLNR